jgi:mono/diheme cytochrome c family protein
MADYRWAQIASIVGGALAAVLIGILAWDRLRDDPQSEGKELAATVGKAVYEAQCASCHGAKLEGQPNWRERLPNGRLPAPPHDATGHTWHHDDSALFNITKNGIAEYAPPGYPSDMPAFADKLSDTEIWAVLGYIKSTWPREQRDYQKALSGRSGSGR